MPLIKIDAGMTDMLLHAREVQRITGIAPRTLRQKVRDKQFPPPRRLGVNAIAWSAVAINRWYDALPEKQPGDSKRRRRWQKAPEMEATHV